MKYNFIAPLMILPEITIYIFRLRNTIFEKGFLASQNPFVVETNPDYFAHNY